MEAREISLQVAAPARYYTESAWWDGLLRARECLTRFVSGSRVEGLSISLDVLAFPEWFDSLPFADGEGVRAACETAVLTEAGRQVRDAFDGLVSVHPEGRQGAKAAGAGCGGSVDSTRTKPVSAMTDRARGVMTTMNDRFLPGVPGAEIEAIFDAAAGRELAAGKFDSPESSAALAANAFGFFLRRAADLPPLPGCVGELWPARSLMLEAEVRFPWSGGRHPVLDCLVTTPSEFIGIESKRFEPFRGKPKSAWSNAYWRPVWGERMQGYESIRDGLHGEPGRYEHLDAAQLVKHAFALRTAVHKRPEYRALAPVLCYVYAEPDSWPNGGAPVDEGAKAHRR